MRAYIDSEKNCVFQWDNKRRLILEGFPAGVVVAYSNECGEPAPVVESFVEDGTVYAKIPPEIMQEPYSIEADIRLDGNTLHKTFITLIPGNKPDDYVMEPVEILRYETLAKRIEALEQPGGGEDSGQKVDIDTTLTKPGQAADAKAVGDALGNKLDKTSLDDAIQNALTQAQESGEFDGAPGENGGYYIPAVTQPDANTMTVSFAASKAGMEDVGDVSIVLPAGKDGEDGETGGHYTPVVSQPTDDTMQVAFTPSKPDMPAVEAVTVDLPVGPPGAPGEDYTLTDDGRQEIAEIAAGMVDVPGGAPGGDFQYVCIVSPEDAVYITVNEDAEGNPLRFTEAYIAVATARSSDATANSTYAIGLTDWYSSWNNKAFVHSLPLYADAYRHTAYVRVNSNILETTMLADYRVAGSIGAATPLAKGAELSGVIGNTALVYNKAVSARFSPANVSIAAGSTPIVVDGFLRAVTVGIDLATGVKLAAGTILEVWYR